MFYLHLYYIMLEFLRLIPLRRVDHRFDIGGLSRIDSAAGAHNKTATFSDNLNEFPAKLIHVLGRACLEDGRRHAALDAEMSAQHLFRLEDISLFTKKDHLAFGEIEQVFKAFVPYSFPERGYRVAELDFHIYNPLQGPTGEFLKTFDRHIDLGNLMVVHTGPDRITLG